MNFPFYIHKLCDLVRERIEKMAAPYKEKEQVISWYYNNKNMLAEIEAAVLEDMAVTKLIEAGSVKEVSVSYDDLMKDSK